MLKHGYVDIGERMSSEIGLGLGCMDQVIFLHPPLEGVKIPRGWKLRQTLPPPNRCNFLCFLMFFNVNLCLEHRYTPYIFVYTPQFQIPRNNPAYI